MLRIFYRHYDCPVNPDVAWQDQWPSAVTGDCPACKARNIEPVDWEEIPEAAQPAAHTGAMTNFVDFVKACHGKTVHGVHTEEYENMARIEFRFTDGTGISIGCTDAETLTILPLRSR